MFRKAVGRRAPALITRINPPCCTTNKRSVASPGVCKSNGLERPVATLDNFTLGVVPLGGVDDDPPPQDPSSTISVNIKKMLEKLTSVRICLKSNPRWQIGP